MRFIQSKAGRGLRRSFKKHGKKTGRLISTVIGTIIVWVCTAVWHGTGIRYYIWGGYYCVIISSSLILETTYLKIRRLLHINENNRLYIFFQILRTVMLVLIADIILAAKDYMQFSIIFKQIVGRSFWVGNDISKEMLHWNNNDLYVCIIGLIVILLVSIVKEKKGLFLPILDKTVFPIRWIVYYLLIFAILFFGYYGSSLGVNDFLYMYF